MDEAFTADEKKLLPVFRESLRDVWRSEFDDDYYLVKWIRARNHDLKKAEKMLRDHVEWRQREKVDTILETYVMPEVIRKYYPGGHCGHDKDGCPLWLEPTGYEDPKGLSQSATKSDIIRSRIYIMEWIHKVILPQRTKEEGHRVTQTNVIFDMRHFGRDHLWKPAMQLFMEITRIVEANYPETMKRCFIIHAPSIFPFVYRIISPLLHENTKKKVMPLSDEEYESVLLKYFDPENFPAYYGGKMMDPNGDTRCLSKVCWGGTVPKEYYLACNKEYMHEVTVSRGSTFKLEYEIDKIGTRLIWEFQTEDHDIGFGVYRKPDETTSKSSKPQKVKTHEMTEVVPTKRCDSQLVREKGEYIVDVPGHYVVRFDNTYSWTRAKHIWYRVDLEAPIPEDLKESDELDAEAQSYLKDVEWNSDHVTDAVPCEVTQEETTDRTEGQ